MTKNINASPVKLLDIDMSKGGEYAVENFRGFLTYQYEYRHDSEPRSVGTGKYPKSENPTGEIFVSIGRRCDHRRIPIKLGQTLRFPELVGENVTIEFTPEANSSSLFVEHDGGFLSHG